MNPSGPDRFRTIRPHRNPPEQADRPVRPLRGRQAHLIDVLVLHRETGPVVEVEPAAYPAGIRVPPKFPKRQRRLLRQRRIPRKHDDPFAGRRQLACRPFELLRRIRVPQGEILRHVEPGIHHAAFLDQLQVGIEVPVAGHVQRHDRGPAAAIVSSCGGRPYLRVPWRRHRRRRRDSPQRPHPPSNARPARRKSAAGTPRRRARGNKARRRAPGKRSAVLCVPAGNARTGTAAASTSRRAAAAGRRTTPSPRAAQPPVT